MAKTYADWVWHSSQIWELCLAVTLFLRFQVKAWGYFRGLPPSYGLGFGICFPLFAEGRSGRGFRASLVDLLGVKGLPGVVDGSLFLSANLGNAVSMAWKTTFLVTNPDTLCSILAINDYDQKVAFFSANHMTKISFASLVVWYLSSCQNSVVITCLGSKMS